MRAKSAMDPERWQNLVDLFTRARNAPAQQRARLLAEVEATDPSLRVDLEAMLAGDESGEDPLPHLRIPLARSISTGFENRWIGRYRLLSRLGAGGMGVIYKAEDPTLKRTVAIKLLVPHSLDDSVAGERLLREAQAAASLHHPNICPIYEIDESEGFRYIVMAALEGENLAQYLLGRGRLAVEEALTIAVQIAEAMQAAHDKGVFHRDIKPANVFVTPQTRGGAHVTLLDFGLAQTRDVSRLTRDGAIAGTLAYMSPEQIRGDRPGASGDIWSFGVVLYEMLSGVKPFGDGPDTVTLHAIQNSDPQPIGSHRPDLPPSVGRIVAHALNKDPARRYASATALLHDLKACAGTSTSGGHSLPPPEDRSRLRLRWAIGAGTLILALAAGAGIAAYTRSRSRGAPPAPQFRQITDTVSENRVTSAALSPDGRRLAFTNIKGDLYLRDLATGLDRYVTTLPGQETKHISWPDDGSKLMLSGVAQGEGALSIWLAPLSGTVRLLVPNAREGSISPDGLSVAYLNEAASEVWVMELKGGTSRRVASDSTRDGFLFVHWLDGGSALGYAQRQQVSSQADSNELGAYHPTNILWRYRIFDLVANSVRATKEGVRMLFPASLSRNRIGFLTWTQHRAPSYSFQEVEIDTRFAAFRPLKSTPVPSGILTVSADREAAKLAVVRTDWQNEIYIAPFDPRSSSPPNPKRLTFDYRSDFPHTWAADGRSVVFESDRSDRARPYTLYRQSVDGGDVTRLIENPAVDVMAQLSPDRRWILFMRKKPGTDGPWTIHRIPAEGGRAEAVPGIDTFDEFRCAAPGGKRCVLRSLADGQFVFHELDPLAGKGRELTRCPWSRTLFGDWSLSFDGSLVAIPEHDRIPAVIRVIDLDSPGSRDHEVSIAGRSALSSVAWTADGKGWIGGFIRVFEKPALRTDSGDLRYIDSQGRTRLLYRTSGSTFAVPSPDGKRFAFIDWLISSNLWLAESP